MNDADDSLQQKIRRHYIESSLQNSWRADVLCLIESWYNELVSLGACCTFAVPQLSAHPLGGNQNEKEK